MGAYFNSMVVKVDGNAGFLDQKGAVKDAFDRRVQEDAYESGQGPYAGNFTGFRGLKFQNKEFDGIHSAEEWIESHQEKWGPAFAVRVKRKANDDHVIWVVGGWSPS